MDTRSLDAATRRAALMMGTAGLAAIAALAQPMPSDAKRHSKKHQNKGDANSRCKKQVCPCQSFIAALCADDPRCPTFTSCCSSFGTCDTTGFLTCIADTNQI